MAVILKKGKFYRDGVEEAPKFGDPDQIRALKEARRPKKCDCMMGFICGDEVTVSTIDDKVKELYESHNRMRDAGLTDKVVQIEDYTDGRKGYARKFKYCPKCGDKINWKL